MSTKPMTSSERPSRSTILHRTRLDMEASSIDTSDISDSELEFFLLAFVRLDELGIPLHDAAKILKTGLRET